MNNSSVNVRYIDKYESLPLFFGGSFVKKCIHNVIKHYTKEVKNKSCSSRSHKKNPLQVMTVVTKRIFF